MNILQGGVLAINGGSSSIKYALYTKSLELLFSGELDNIGSKHACLNGQPVKAEDHQEAMDSLMDWLEQQPGFDTVAAIGHRVVQGMQHTQPEVITDKLIAELQAFIAYDPEHLPDEIKLVEAFHKRYPKLVQVACFDTMFHSDMPPVAKLVAIPRKFKIQRYGFHGLSYAFLMEELNEYAKGKVILAHLGSGASLAAVKNGKSIDTSMGFTPAAGIPMSTRSGDLDPGVAWYLMKAEILTAKQFNHLVNHESGLLGVSGNSADMQELLKSKETYAREAVELFCYQAKKYIGAYAAALGGLDTLVFSGGIGENSHEVRSLICQNLQFLGIELDTTKSRNNEPLISKGKVNIRVIKTNEELMIARMVKQIIKNIK